MVRYNFQNILVQTLDLGIQLNILFYFWVKIRSLREVVYHLDLLAQDLNLNRKHVPIFTIIITISEQHAKFQNNRKFAY